MTASQVRALMHAAIGNTPHELGAIEQVEWYIRWMNRTDLMHAARCYAAIVGERTLPANIGLKRLTGAD